MQSLPLSQSKARSFVTASELSAHSKKTPICVFCSQRHVVHCLSHSIGKEPSAAPTDEKFEKLTRRQQLAARLSASQKANTSGVQLLDVEAVRSCVAYCCCLHSTNMHRQNDCIKSKQRASQASGARRALPLHLRSAKGHRKRRN